MISSGQLETAKYYESFPDSFQTVLLENEKAVKRGTGSNHMFCGVKGLGSLKFGENIYTRRRVGGLGDLNHVFDGLIFSEL